ncbi:uncharacterized protein LOC116261497 [Nymphaea colorata]|uniref:Uncharacterized protein n=1 Tax=Nymphaea colorata TaxID=210225 RepID=A0A5K1GFI7_9MAGN|nr:uncharacterized protein LOC116261497 [Nymphaea colorata]
MEARAFHAFSPKSVFLPTNRPLRCLSTLPTIATTKTRRLRAHRIRAANTPETSQDPAAVDPPPDGGANGDGKEYAAASAAEPMVEIRFRRGTRRRARLYQEEGANPPVARKPPPKDWESMTLSEKAMELYVGEKGILFWLNKFAYASIFIVIGGWILFRFVGPYLGLYQLDGSPLSPTDVFKGSS